MNFKKVGATVGTTAAPDKGRQLRGMGGADGLNPSNSGLRLAFPAQKIPSAARVAAGAFGFLIFSRTFGTGLVRRLIQQGYEAIKLNRRII